MSDDICDCYVGMGYNVVHRGIVDGNDIKGARPTGGRMSDEFWNIVFVILMGLAVIWVLSGMN